MREIKNYSYTPTTFQYGDMMINGEKYMVKYAVDVDSKDLYLFIKNNQGISFEINGNLKYKSELTNAFNIIYSSQTSKQRYYGSPYQLNGVEIAETSGWLLYKYYDPIYNWIASSGHYLKDDASFVTMFLSSTQYSDTLWDTDSYIELIKLSEDNKIISNSS